MDMEYKLVLSDSFWNLSFSAMASPCEILFQTDSSVNAERFAEFAYNETKRIERKYSRYLKDNIIYQINNSNGSTISVDDETARILNYANQCYDLSDGFFDITSGVLRNCWEFKGREFSPDESKLNDLLKSVGWEKIKWEDQKLTLLSNMEIDFGGIGKEYAVDRVAEFAIQYDIEKVMVNFGGDIRAISNDNSSPWVIGIENPDLNNNAVGKIELQNGGIATSGDSKRFCFYKKKKLGHILNPKTGWPVDNAPHSVTVISGNCTEAGTLATMAMLKGLKAEEFLNNQSVKFNSVRD